MSMSNLRHCIFAFTGVSLTLLLSACGGGGDGTASSSAPATSSTQCASNGTCPVSGPIVNGGTPGPLCPASLDYGTTFAGGSGAGEFIKLRFDTKARTYQLQVIESPVPKENGKVSPTRAGVTFTGTFANLTNLPTPEQNRCALALQSATPSDGTSQALIDPAHPPVIFLGNGVAGGGIPGATISYPGVLGLGTIPQTTFPIYPVLAFAQTETDFSKVAGTFNVLGYHQVPSGGALTNAQSFAPATAQTTETLNADGSCTKASGSCVTTGNAWQTRAQNDGGFESSNNNGSRRYPAFYSKAVTSNNNSRAKGVLVVGKLAGALVPLVIRVGYADVSNIFALNVDDESGLALMAPTTRLASGQIDGGYIGSGSDLGYAVSLVQGDLVHLLDPFTMKEAGGYQLDFTQNTSGMVATTDNSGTTGALIANGRVFAHLAGSGSPTFRVSVLASP